MTKDTATPKQCPLCNPLAPKLPFGQYHIGCAIAEEYRKEQLARGNDSASLGE